MSALAQAETTLIVYSYDSLVSKNSWGEQVARGFEKKMRGTKTPVRVKLVSVGEGAQILSRLKLDQKRGKNIAHIVWGIDPETFGQLKNELDEIQIPKDFPVRKELAGLKLPVGFVPFDFGIYAFIQDTENLPLDQAPQDWGDLISPRFKKKILLEDPRTSTPGLAWVLASETAFGKNEVLLYWKSLQANWLTLSPSWSQAYALFLKKQAPLVWSYVTSQAYHQELGDKTNRYHAVLFTSGQPIQVEGISILKSAADFEKVKPLAQAFVNHVVSKESQSSLPKMQWMFPVRSDVVLPGSFKNLPQPKSLYSIFDSLGNDGRKEVLKRWNEALVR